MTLAEIAELRTRSPMILVSTLEFRELLDLAERASTAREQTIRECAAEVVALHDPHDAGWSECIDTAESRLLALLEKQP